MATANESYRPCERVLDHTITEIDGETYAYGTPPEIGDAREHVREELHVLLRGLDGEWQHILNSFQWRMDNMDELTPKLAEFWLEEEIRALELWDQYRTLPDQPLEDFHGPRLTRYLAFHPEKITLELLLKAMGNKPKVFFGNLFDCLPDGRFAFRAESHPDEDYKLTMRQVYQKYFMPLRPELHSDLRLSQNGHVFMIQLRAIAHKDPELWAVYRSTMEESFHHHDQRFMEEDRPKWEMLVKLYQVLRAHGYTHMDLVLDYCGIETQLYC